MSEQAGDGFVRSLIAQADLVIEDGKVVKCRDGDIPGIIARKPEDAEIKDSGERRTFQTGAQRDRGTMKGAPILRAVHALNRYDRWNEKGARKYAARNWEKGMPLSEFYNSAQRHLDKLIAGYVDEDHAAAALWNVAHLIETKHRIDIGLLPKELDDLPTTFAGVTMPSF